MNRREAIIAGMASITAAVAVAPTADAQAAQEANPDLDQIRALLRAHDEAFTNHLEHEDIEKCEIYWQGGEAMIMGPAWFAEAGELMDSAAAARGRRFTHYLQTNLISYSPSWNDVLRTMFSGSLGTSMLELGELPYTIVFRVRPPL